jgi:hypothetical protein
MTDLPAVATESAYEAQERATFDPWALVTDVMFHLSREGLRPKLSGENFDRAKHAAEELLSAMQVTPVVPNHDALDTEVPDKVALR